MPVIEYVYLAAQPTDCVVGGYVILCGCGSTSPDFDLYRPYQRPAQTLWGWQDNVEAGEGIQEWQDNVPSAGLALGKWSNI